MTNETAEHTNLESSAHRLTEAAELIERFRSTISTLAEFKAMQAKATDALENSNTALGALLENLAGIGDRGKELIVALERSTKSAEAMFDQSTIKTIKSDLASVNDTVVAFQNQVLTERDEAQKQLAALQSKIAAMPERVRKKYGMLATEPLL